MSVPHSSALKEKFLAQHGIWSLEWESLLKLDPSYFAAYLKLRAAASKGKHVTPKFQELIHLSVASVVSTMFVPGIEAHTRAALDAGASKEEILEVLALTSVCGIHSISCGLPVLMEILGEQGNLPEQPEKLDERRQALKADFEKKRGYWGPTWDSVLAFDPDFFEAYTQFSAEPFREEKSHLSAKEKELIYCAFDACATHMYTPGLKLHMQNAIRYGATPDELMQVLELASLIGVHSSMVGAQVLEKTLRMGESSL